MNILSVLTQICKTRKEGVLKEIFGGRKNILLMALFSCHIQKQISHLFFCVDKNILFEKVLLVRAVVELRQKCKLYNEDNAMHFLTF